MMSYTDYDATQLRGRNRRLFTEWRLLAERFENDQLVEISVAKRNGCGLPTEYMVTYNIHTMCGVAGCNSDDSEAYNLTGTELECGEIIYADRFVMMLKLPPSYPCVDGAPQLQFVDRDEDGSVVAMPWPS